MIIRKSYLWVLPAPHSVAEESHTVLYGAAAQGASVVPTP